ncbi:MAG: NAD(P)-dependent oxidoreductase [Deltaproteobacteria bacterium]|nr:NAD(P)-dependent oxidoreductase [Deltaproteobacteria bacterium]
MKILLLGHEGYLGRGLFAYLQRRQHEVIGWDKKEDLFNLDAAFLARSGIELLINLSVAADRQAANYQIDSATDLVNVQGARHIASALKGSDTTWIQMSTREVLGPVYGIDDVVETEQGYRPKRLVKEDQPYAPTNLYGKSKVMAELISESHPRSNVVRLTTCYTDYDHPAGNWVLALIRAATTGKPVRLTAGGRQFRDPLHIDDLGALMEQLHEKKIAGEKIHAGGGEQNYISLLELVKQANPAVVVESAPGGDYGFAFDIDKAARLVGWRPQLLIKDRIKIIADNIARGVQMPPGI